MTFARLRAWDWVAFIAALALLFVSAVDWYSNVAGENLRHLEQISKQDGDQAGPNEKEVQEDAATEARGQEKNAWQAGGAIDRVILVALLVTAALGVLAAFAAASGRSSRSAIPPAGLAALAALVTALLVGYRIVQEPGIDAITTVKTGAPLALVMLGLLAFSSARAIRGHQEPEPA